MESVIYSYCKFRYLRIDNLRQKFLIERLPANVQFLNIRREKLELGPYLLVIVEIVNSVQ